MFQAYEHYQVLTNIHFLIHLLISLIQSILNS